MAPVVEVLVDALGIGLTAVGGTLVLRRVPPIAGWVRRGLKPFACNLCCATWSTLALTVGLGVLGVLMGSTWAAAAWVAAAWMPAVAIATIGLHHADPPPPPALDLLPAPDEPWAAEP